MNYELTILTENEADGAIRGLLKALGIKDYKFEYEGKKRLAYRIGGIEYAHYYFVNLLDLEHSLYEELADKLPEQHWILRYLLVKEILPSERKYLTRKDI